MADKKKIYPKATKSRLVKFLRDRGLDIPSIRKTLFEKYRRSYWLHWEDSGGVWRKTSYFACDGRPVLYIDDVFVDITIKEVREYGLYEEI